jgi:hypothetical protein
MAGLCMDHRCAESRHGADKLIDLLMCDFGRNVQIQGSQHCLLGWIGLGMMSMHPENISDKFNVLNVCKYVGTRPICLLSGRATSC